LPITKSPVAKTAVRFYHWHSMNTIASIARKYSLQEVALFAMFTSGLLIAGLIVSVRNRIEMSDPIQLPYSGLSLSLPAGPGWQRSTGWTYEKPGGGFTMGATLAVGNRPVAVVQCRYLPDLPQSDPKKVLSEMVAAASLQVVRSGRIAGDVEIFWIQTARPRGVADTFIGASALPDGSILEISVRAPMDHLLADKVFRLIAKSLKFDPDGGIAPHGAPDGRPGAGEPGEVVLHRKPGDTETVRLVSNVQEHTGTAGFRRPAGLLRHT